MEKSPKLKYLPVKIAYSRDEDVVGQKTFRVDLGTHPIEFPLREDRLRKFLERGIRKLRLDVQCTYRKQIRNSGKTFDDFVLEVIQDETCVTNPASQNSFFPNYEYYIYCTLNLIEKNG